jgi:hypothetical protein
LIYGQATAGYAVENMKKRREHSLMFAKVDGFLNWS